jgi:activator of HSP90 ATPase
LNSVEFSLPGGSVRIKSVDAKGDSSYSVRKGKKIVAFHYDIDFDWEAALKDGDGNALVTNNGTYKIIEFSPEDDHDVRLPNTSALHPHIR